MTPPQGTNLMKFPMLYQARPRRMMQDLRAAGVTAPTLADVPDQWFAKLASLGFDWIYLLGIWQTGSRSRDVSIRHPAIAAHHESHLPGCREEDVCGSPFAISAYVLHDDFGPADALMVFRSKANHHGLRLMLDFVPNHVGLDHPWAINCPEMFIHSDPKTPAGQAIAAIPGGPELCHGRDPFFPPWPDTYQLNLFHPKVRTEHCNLIASIATQCDGLRCDMAMLPLSDIFESTWNESAMQADGYHRDKSDYWPKLISAARDINPEFVFLGECYWDREWDLMTQGFNYCYDKRLYDRLHHGLGEQVRWHLNAEPAFRDRCAHFLENHDEPRVAGLLNPQQHKAAAMISFFAPGLRFVHQGQELGYKVSDSVHLRRVVQESADPDIARFYEWMLPKAALAGNHSWKLATPEPASAGNVAHLNIVAMMIDTPHPMMVVVNCSSSKSECKIRLPISGSQIVFKDLVTEKSFEWSGEEVRQTGVFIDLPAWGYHLLTWTR